MESETLPSELIFEILSRTSLETLEQCKAVSDSWKQMIYEATFLPLYCKRANCLFGYFFQDIKDHKYTSVLVSDEGGAAAASAIEASWPCADMKILAASGEGILCCQRRVGKNYRYYACKLATKQWQALPNPKLRYATAAVAVVVVESHPLRYLIIRLSECGMQYNCEIFDSKKWAWEKIECESPYGEIVHPCPAGITIGKSVHWLTTADNVLMFDITERSFRHFPLPETVRCDDSYGCKQLVEYEGGLGLRCLIGERLELWVAERRWQWEWRKKLVVDMTVVGKNMSCPQLIEFCNTDVAFMKTAAGAAFYNRQNHNLSRVEVPYELRNPIQIIRFRSDFETVQLKGGR